MVIYDANLEDLLQKVWNGGRIIPVDAMRLYRLPLEELAALADRRRRLARESAYDGRGNEIITYIVDRNVNYTNICNVYCKFCAFYRTEKDSDSYVISLPAMDQKIEETLALGTYDAFARQSGARNPELEHEG
jgi:cyclic dehypoxanthinyl futalosine synthase